MSKHKRRARVPQIPKPAPKRVCPKCKAPVHSTAHRCEDYLPKPKLAPGERAVTEAGRLLWMQMQQKHVQETQALLQVLARDAGVTPGEFTELDPQRMVFFTPKPDAPAKPPAKNDAKKKEG